jgi:glycosyltransferase involved in cell wall biosynthesis
MQKIVWLCHFSNKEVCKLLGTKISINEFAPWITELALLFEKCSLIELHIISPHEYIARYKHFTLRGIHYHFFNAHIPIWGRHWPSFFRIDYWTKFVFNRYMINKIVFKINPSIIHLHGAENAYYSSSIIQFKNKLPVFITIQGFISHTASIPDYQVRQKIQWEQKILHSFKHFGYRTQRMGMDIIKYNPQAVLHWHHYPIKKITAFSTPKKFDIVFFAYIAKDKGIEDLLKAIALIKQKGQIIRLLVIGWANSKYLDYLNELILKLGIFYQIEWAGFLATQNCVHKKASEARISVLPTYNDIISGTIIESLFLKLPVVAYDVGSIHEINKEEEIISLVKKGDINGLADTIQRLLNNENKLTELADKGLNRASLMFDNNEIFGNIINAYKCVINDFKGNVNKFIENK